MYIYICTYVAYDNDQTTRSERSLDVIGRTNNGTASKSRNPHDRHQHPPFFYPKWLRQLHAPTNLIFAKQRTSTGRSNGSKICVSRVLKMTSRGCTTPSSLLLEEEFTTTTTTTSNKHQPTIPAPCPAVTPPTLIITVVAQNHQDVSVHET